MRNAIVCNCMHKFSANTPSDIGTMSPYPFVYLIARNERATPCPDLNLN